MAEISILNGYKIKDKKAIRFYNSVNEMKEDTSLKEGMYAVTKGYYAINDGGGAEYYITATQSSTEYQEEIENGLYSTLIINKYINVKTLGAYGDGNHDDINYFKTALNLIINNPNVNTLFIPKGDFNISNTFFHETTNQSVYNGLLIIGEGRRNSTINLVTNNEEKWIYNSTNNEKYGRLNFKDLHFTTDNREYGNGFLQYSTGTEKQLRFENCDFNLGTTLKTTGTGNADLNRFINCSITSTGNCIVLDNAQSVDNEFYGCAFSQTGGNTFYIKQGGSTHVFGGEIEGFTNATIVKYPLNGTQGIGNLETIFNSVRFELHTGAKLVDSENTHSGYLTFNNCNIGSVDNINNLVYVYANARKEYRFNNCVISKNLTIKSECEHTTGATGNGSLIYINNCTCDDTIWKQCSIIGNSARIIGEGNNRLADNSQNTAQDFDMGSFNRTYSSVSPKIKIINLKKEGLGLPNSTQTNYFYLPSNCYIKRIYVNKPALSDSSNTDYQLHIGSSDKLTVIAESTVESFRDELIIDEKDLGRFNMTDFAIWGTGETSSVTSKGVAYIEYI